MKKMDKCVWTMDMCDLVELWQSGCNDLPNYFGLGSDPRDSSWSYCPYCGKEIEAKGEGE
jgi:hypothetical protein